MLEECVAVFVVAGDAGVGDFYGLLFGLESVAVYVRGLCPPDDVVVFAVDELEVDGSRQAREVIFGFRDNYRSFGFVFIDGEIEVFGLCAVAEVACAEVSGHLESKSNVAVAFRLGDVLISARSEQEGACGECKKFELLHKWVSCY